MRLLDWLSARTESLTRNVADAGSAALYVRQLLRGNRLRVVPSPPPTGPRVHPPSGRPPVLLVHGYLATRGSLHLLERHLTERGHVVLTYRMGPVNVGGIRQAAGLIARKVESLVQQTSVRRVHVVGHSMGGLVGLYYVKRLGGRDRVSKLIMLGSPVLGTWSAVLGLVTAPLGRASVELLPGSPVLRELRSEPLPLGVEVVTVAGDRDFLAPDGATRLEGVRHISLAASHSGLLVDPRVADTIDALLREEPVSSGGPDDKAARAGRGSAG